MLESQTRTTFKLSYSIREKMLNEVMASGCGIRGKSKWICDAINTFAALKSYLEYIDTFGDMEKLSRTEVVVIDMDTRLKLDNAIIRVRARNPLLEGVQSMVIRASILYRLHNNSQVK